MYKTKERERERERSGYERHLRKNTSACTCAQTLAYTIVCERERDGPDLVVAR